MSRPRQPDPAQLVLSVLSSRWEEFWPGLKDTLETRLGEIDYLGDPLAFDHTHYYNKEFGTPLFRRLMGFAPLAPQETLPEIKLWCYDLEQRHADSHGQRLFNLDPGLLTQERLVLATGKNYTHRMYLGQGIWGDLTLIFQNGRWRDQPWTFPDYASPELQEHLTRLRTRYRQKIGL